MSEIKCINCANATRVTKEKRGIGKDNVEYIGILECKLGFEISMGGVPGPDCNGDYFEEK